MEEKIRCYTQEDEEFPDKLKNFKDCPKQLYVKGHLPDKNKKSVAIIGARMCSYYGRTQAYEFAKELSSCGVQIISGMARGIDGWAHKGAIDGGGKTFAVLGCGVDICYPSQNINLYREIPKTGGILSEYEEGEKPLGWHFPLRNRIISGLADVVLVIEAKKKSGSLITVEYALEQGKSVYALPGRVGEALSEGCNNLIFQGAQIAKSVEIILEELEISDKMAKENKKKTEIRLASKEEMVYSCVDLKPKHLDEIMKVTHLELAQIQEILVRLELMGLVTEPIKNYYARAVGGLHGKVFSDCGITGKSKDNKKIPGF